ncbi:hypothetical protein DRO54_06690 [Candidatus Bathyarchaeota archaeon]|nr:MAG: hypothetical protein DRO54_06690 [Candidatus Bathyarchaeota archaeon]
MVFQKVGKAIGKALASIVKFFRDLMFSQMRNIEQMKKDIAAGSIKEEWFRTPEFKQAAKELKETLKSSPETITEFIREIHTKLHGKLYDLVINLVMPEKELTEEEALKSARALTAYYIDFILFSFLVDIIAETVGLGQIEAVGRASQLFVTTFGFEAYAQAVLQPAIEQTLTEKLRHYWNAKFPVKLPSISDLVSGVVREFFVSKDEYVDIITKTGIPRADAERFYEMMRKPPKEFVEFCRKLGYSEKWAEMYWWNHWVIPTFEQARIFFFRQAMKAFLRSGLDRVQDALKRGVWKDAQEAFRFLQRLADLSPVFRQYWEELSWNLPTKIDSRWMFEWGIIGKKELKGLLLASGLHPEWVDKVADAYVRNQLRDELNRVRSILIREYRDGYIDKDDFIKRLRELGFAEHVIKASVEVAEEERRMDWINEQVKELDRLLMKGKIDFDKWEQEMRELGLAQDYITQKRAFLEKIKKIKEAE